MRNAIGKESNHANAKYHRGDDLEITFKTRKIAKIYNSEKDLCKALGNDQAKKVMMRLYVLRNAPSLLHVPNKPPERLHLLTGKRRGQFAVDLKHPKRLIFVPNHDPVPLRPDGGIDKEKVTAITIIALPLDYH